MRSCPVCRGSRTIKLPLYTEPSTLIELDASMPTDATVSARVYPCPQCSPSAPRDRVRIVTFGGQADAGLDMSMRGKLDPRFRDHLRRHAADALLREMLRSDVILFKEGTPDRWTGNTSFRATVASSSAAIP